MLIFCVLLLGLYAALSNNIGQVRSILLSLRSHTRKQEIIDAQIPKKGIPEFGIPGSCTALISAMAFGSPDIVELLLENGANPYISSTKGNNSLMCACAYGQLENVKFWLGRFRDWNLSTKGKLGNDALGNAVYMGPDRLELVKFLLEKGAAAESVTFNGTSTLMSACATEDSDPEVVRLLLKQKVDVHRQVRPMTMKWRFFYWYAKTMVRTGMNRSSLMQSLAERQGRTALHYAARRGDIDVMKVLMSSGADPNRGDEKGLSAKDLFESLYSEYSGS